MHWPEVPNMAEPITIPETSVVKNEVEEALPSDHEELFDFPTHILSPNRDDVPVSTFCCFSGPCKLEPDTQELGSTCFDSEEISHSTMSSFYGGDQQKLFGPKPILKVMKLTDQAIEELTAGIWRCGSCSKVEKSSFMLDLHIDTGCEELSPIECDICPAISRDYGNFVVHIMEHQMGETRRCPICLCECIGDVSQHLVMHGHLSPSASELEPRDPSTVVSSNSLELDSEGKNLENHKMHLNTSLRSKKPKILKSCKKTYTGIKQYICDVCDKSFSNGSRLKRHQRMHTGEKPFKCDVCEKAFSQSNSLNYHQRVHRGEKPFKCDVCEKTFSVSSNLTTHQRVHTGVKPFKCEACEKTFSQSSSFIKHQRVHTGEKPFTCDVCDKTFSQSDYFIKHQRVHTGVKPFKCEVCNKAFSQSSSLNQHQRVHRGEKPFKCGVCEKTFSVSSNLITHQRVHTGVKPFKCEVCEKTFSQRSNLIRHQRVHVHTRESMIYAR
ncbi:endothelial zinc finger protein induced by tumor necrosis factor alpha-like isoform X2 [Artemia franciscana]|uniref:endothelial zinc finger protein induced by tumor necrosis factor alpha-like isoform X2 n=1 Tax=Artemia franciscana TaxID=6661 RepID=UPI0032DBC8BD